jgi:hypothetical protein
VVRPGLFALFVLGIAMGSCGPRQTAGGSAARVDSARTPPSDTTKFTFPWSYYFPVEEVEVGDYQVRWLALRPPQVTLARGDPDSTVGYSCNEPVVAPDTVDITCPVTPIGSIRVAGSFTSLIHAADTVDIEHQVLLIGAVTVLSVGRAVFSKRVRFAYWQGE